MNNSSRTCANTTCGQTFTPRRPNQLYCSRRCSKLTRNRRYYDTYRGRMNKRAAASQYFQRHRLELYEKRLARFARHVQEEIARIQSVYAVEKQHYKNNPEVLQSLKGMEAHELSAVSHSVRAKYDYHPSQMGDGPFPDPRRWELRHPWFRYPFHCDCGKCKFQREKKWLDIFTDNKRSQQ